MALTYFIQNFMPLMILLGLLALMFVNRDVKIPATSLFAVSISIVILLTCFSSFNEYTDITGMSAEEAARVIRLHTWSSTLSYVLRPCLILMEILIVLSDSKYKILYAIPAIANGVIFSTALFGGEIAFHIGPDNRWYAGPLHQTIYISQVFYLILLLTISIASFRNSSKRKSIVLIVMVVQGILVAILESNAVEPSYTDSITALCILEYYIYLSTFYRQQLNDKLDNYIDDIEKAQSKLQNLTKEVITAFANSIDAKDKYTHGHSSRVAQYSRRLAAMNGKSQQECDEIYYAGLLHDIGKIGIPESIITKEGKLTPEEYDTIKQHPSLGAQILGSINEFPYLSVGARSHHERYDGKGYPEGLKGDEIPEIARIISVADAYDAMSSKRSYRDPIPQQKVREEIVEGTGTQFDPEYARLMLHLIDEDLEYKMSEREESNDPIEQQELIVDEYRSTVSEGILVIPAITTITFTLLPEKASTEASPAPGIILFDSLDGKVHTDAKEIKDLNYFEYGEITPDFETKTIGARKMTSEVKNKRSADIRLSCEYRIEAVRIRDHALIRVFGYEKSAEFIVALPDNSRFMFLGLTGEYCRFIKVNTEKSPKESPADYIPRIAEEISYINVPAGDIPNVQVDGYRTAHSEGIRIKDGLKVTFHAKCLPTARLVWHCPCIDIFSSEDGVVNGSTYRDLAFMRFDGEFWECDPHCSAKLDVTKTDAFDGWDAWKQRNQDGFDAEVTIHVKNNEITFITDNAGISIRNRAIITGLDTPIYASLTGDQVAITNIRIAQK